MGQKLQARIVRREDTDKVWERVVFAELLVPDQPNVYGDLWSREGIKQACYAFAKQGFGIDVEHDNWDLTGALTVVESFIVRANDPDFIEGSWVIGMHIGHDDLWQSILDGEINGFSYEAVVLFYETDLAVSYANEVTGTTEPSVTDGHTHTFLAFVGEDGRVHSGATDEVDGHSHQITESTVTEEADGHVHRYNIVGG